MSLAIAYQMKKRGQKMAHGGMEGPCEEHGSRDCEMCHGGKMAEGGEMGVHEPIKASDDVGAGMSKAGVYTEAAHNMRDKKSEPEETAKYLEGKAKELHHQKLHELKSMKKPNLYAEGGDVDEEHDEHDMVSRIMKQRSNHYSEGGRVANEDHIEADFEPNEFDDLAKDDHLEFHDTGANSGDELGDEQEDEDRHDIVSRIMKSRKLKDRNPRIT